jgi:hypothetical protein
MGYLAPCSVPPILNIAVPRPTPFAPSRSIPTCCPNPDAMTDAKITRGHSCVSCQQRKVKCDGQRPCSACSKYGKECVSKTGPQASRRRLSATPSSRDSPQAVRRNRINPVTEALSPDGQVVLDGDDRHQRRYVEKYMPRSSFNRAIKVLTHLLRTASCGPETVSPTR